jgi:hypothetical protein
MDQSKPQPRENLDRPNDVDSVFASLGESESEPIHIIDDFEGGENVEDNPPSTPLQFPLSALFLAMLLTGLFSLAYLYQRTFGFLLFFAMAAAMGSRAKGKRERAIATMFFGGAAALCAGLMLAEASQPAIGLSGLAIACVGGYSALHGLALVVVSFWE